MGWRWCGRCGQYAFPIASERSIRRYCFRCQHLRDRPSFYAQRWRTLIRVMTGQISNHSRHRERQRALAAALQSPGSLPVQDYHRLPDALTASRLWAQWPTRYVFRGSS